MNFAPWHITSVSYFLKESECITSYWMLSLNILFRLIFCINRRFIMSEFDHYLDLNHGSKEHLRCAWTYIGRCLVKQKKNTSITAHSFIVYWKAREYHVTAVNPMTESMLCWFIKAKIKIGGCAFLRHFCSTFTRISPLVTWHGSFLKLEKNLEKKFGWVFEGYWFLKYLLHSFCTTETTTN